MFGIPNQFVQMIQLILSRSPGRRRWSDLRRVQARYDVKEPLEPSSTLQLKGPNSTLTRESCGTNSSDTVDPDDSTLMIYQTACAPDAALSDILRSADPEAVQERDSTTPMRISHSMEEICSTRRRQQMGCHLLRLRTSTRISINCHYYSIHSRNVYTLYACH